MGEAVSYCSRCGTMIGGRRPGETGAFRAGLEQICPDCDLAAKPKLPPKTETAPTPPSRLLRRPSTNRRKATRRIPSNRMPARSKSNALLVLLLAGGLVLVVILVAVLASK